MFRSWWQKIKQHPMRSIFVSIACVLGIVLLIGGYFFNWTWTGFGPYTPPTSDFQRGVTLYDWLQLFFIPAAIAFGVWWLNRLQQQRDQQLADQRAQTERKAAEKQAQAERKAAENRAQVEREAAERQAQTERDVALDNQREAALQDYIDNMSKLLLENNLGGSGKDDEVRKVARVRTLTVLPRLDKDRKRSVLQFLYESGLINNVKKIVDLSGADLSSVDLNATILEGADLSATNLRGAGLIFSILTGANLSFTHLEKAELRGAILKKADMHLAKLQEANLQEANLDGAVLYRAKLMGAKVTTEQLNKAMLLEGATMPDGTKHD